MARVEKTVFISYRRTNVAWALAIYQALSHDGFDVFFDYKEIASGDFESVILENIRTRAHFVVLLTPSALERTADPADWLRREIEYALETGRNVVPLTLEGFDFGTPSIDRYLTGTLADLKRYNALGVPAEYFDEAMARLSSKHLNVSLDAVTHPHSRSRRRAAASEMAKAAAAPIVRREELTALAYFERGVSATDVDEQLRFYDRALQLDPSLMMAYNNRGNARQAKRDFDGAIEDYNEALRLKLNDADVYFNRGIAWEAKGDEDGAMKDYNEALRLKPDYVDAYVNRGTLRRDNGDIAGAMDDFREALRLAPGDMDVHFNRAEVWEDEGDFKSAIADLQQYLDMGGGVRDGDQDEVEKRIRDLKEKL